MLVAAGAFRLVFVFIAARLYDQAEETARTAAAALQPKAGQGDPQAMSLWGGLTPGLRRVPDLPSFMQYAVVGRYLRRL